MTSGSVPSSPRRRPTWREMQADTSPEMTALQLAFFRDAPPWRKLECVMALNETVRVLALVGLRERFPDADAGEMRCRLAEVLLGPELAARLPGLCLPAVKVARPSRSGVVR